MQRLDRSAAVKLLVLLDIHTNLPVFEAILALERSAYPCVFPRDIVDYSPFLRECINILKPLMKE